MLPITFASNAYQYGERSDGGTHGLVLTKPRVVELILDLAGYRETEDISARRLLEPSCGHGAFVTEAVRRLMAAAKHGGVDPTTLGHAILAFDIEQEHVDRTRIEVVDVLKAEGVSAEHARKLAERWVRHGDFLLAPIEAGFDFVIGNPPYVRIEHLSPELIAEYRRRFLTLFDRADLYVAFIERSLSLLATGGVLSFICADRWTLNRYGAPLRKLIATEYSVRAYVDLHHASPFESDVIAYPSIFVIGREATGRPVRVVSLSGATEAEWQTASPFEDLGASCPGVTVSEYPRWFTGEEPWVISSPEQLAILRDLEGRLPLIESNGTSIRIGIATGCDRVYIVPADADIEADRLLPLVMRHDIHDGTIRDAGRCVINTYEERGAIDLSRYPRLGRYFEEHTLALRARHIAKGGNPSWFRTIDRPYPAMVDMPKLLIPDISGSNDVIFEKGCYYPHHNLYFIISDEWDLEVLGGILCSRVALFFIWSYAVKMRGGYLRFQAQYLRRIRVPAPETISVEIKASIKTAFRERDFSALDELARLAYGLATLPQFDFLDARRRHGTPAHEPVGNL